MHSDAALDSLWGSMEAARYRIDNQDGGDEQALIASVVRR